MFSIHVCLVLSLRPSVFVIYSSSLSCCFPVSPPSCLFLSVPPVETYPLRLIALFWFLLLGWCLSEVGRVWVKTRHNSCLSMILTAHTSPDCVCSGRNILTCCFYKFLESSFSTCWCTRSSNVVFSATAPPTLWGSLVKVDLLGWSWTLKSYSVTYNH